MGALFLGFIFIFVEENVNFLVQEMYLPNSVQDWFEGIKHGHDCGQYEKV